MRTCHALKVALRSNYFKHFFCGLIGGYNRQVALNCHWFLKAVGSLVCRLHGNLHVFGIHTEIPLSSSLIKRTRNHVSY